jgi:hypothetical protein
LQKQSLLYKTQKKNFFFVFFFDFVDGVEFYYTGFIRYTNNNQQVLLSKNVVVHVYILCLRKPSHTEIEKLLKKLEEVPFSFLVYKIALKLKLL